MKHMVRGFVCLAFAVGVAFAASAEVPEESQLQLGLSFSDSEAVVTVPASESRVPMKVRLVWGEGKGVDVATVTATGGVFRVDARKVPVIPGTMVHAELVSAYDVVEYVESHGAEYVDVGTALTAGIKVSMDAQFTSAEVTQTAWGFSSRQNCWLGCQDQKYHFGINSINVSPLERVSSSVHYERLDLQHAVVGETSFDNSQEAYPFDTLKVFACGAMPGFWTKMKLWSLTVENVATDETLVDFIPVRKSGVGALYDLVNGVLRETPSGELSCGGETVAPAGSCLGVSPEVPYAGRPMMSLAISGIDAVVTVPANEFRRVPMVLRLVWGETGSVDLGAVTATGGVFKTTIDLPDGTKVHAELVSAYDVVEYVESHGTEYVDVGTTLVAGIKVSMDAQFTSAEVTQTAWGFSASRSCWLGNNENIEKYHFESLPFENTSVLNRVLSSVYYETLAKVHLVIGSVGGDRLGPGSTPGDGLKIFASGTGPGFWTPMKLWAFTVENVAKGETLVDFIPVRKDGVGALYDVEHGVLYEAKIKEKSEGGLSCGGGTVTPGGACLGVSNEATFESVCVAMASEENLVADGEPHQGSVNVIYPADGYEVKWAWSDDLTAFVHDGPESFTEIGEHRNAVRVTREGYRPWQGESVIRLFAAGSHRAVSARRVSNDAFVIAWGPHFERTDVYVVWDAEDHPDAEKIADWPNSRLALPLTDASKPGEAEFKCPDGARFVRVVVLKNRTDIGVDDYLESLTSTGTQILDLDYLPTEDTAVEIDVKMTATQNTSSVPFFGCSDEAWSRASEYATGTQWMIWYYKAWKEYALYFTADPAPNVRVTPADPAQRDTLKIYPGRTFSIGSSSKSITKNPKIPQNSKFAIFGIRASDAVRSSATQSANPTVYEVRLYEGETLVRQFRPAVLDGTALMVDILDPTRLALNVGTTTDFIRGAEIRPIDRSVRKFDFGKPFGGLTILLR